MRKVYILFDESNEVVVVYDDKDLATKMKPILEKQLEEKLRTETHKTNPDIKVIRRKD